MKIRILILFSILFILSSCTKISKSEFEYFTDVRDGQKYKVIRVGNLLWLAENLNYEFDNCWCYNNDKENCKKYGKLYTWWSASKLIPRGWRLPTDRDWNELIDYFGGKDSMYIKFVVNQDERFKIPYCGMRFSDGKFYGLGKIAGFWSGEEDNKNYAWVRYAKEEVTELSRGSTYKWEAFSVRCVKEIK
jgi:uncharacterized protein (TIGR02145 family)